MTIKYRFVIVHCELETHRSNIYLHGTCHISHTFYLTYFLVILNEIVMLHSNSLLTES